MRRTIGFLVAQLLLLAACSPSTPAVGTDTSTTDRVDSPSTTTSVAPLTTTTGSPETTVSYPVCDYDAPWPDAPDDWYEDTPVYVGNNSPIEAVKGFVATIPGFETAWIDRDHNGWVSVGFVGVDVEEVQSMLEAEFPDEGVVAVELRYTRAQLEQMAAGIQTGLPEEMYAQNVHEIGGWIEIFVGLLTPENLAIVEEAAGDAPYCVEGLDPELYDQSPQQTNGEGWAFLGVVDRWLGDAVDGWGETPVVMTDQAAVDTLWTDLGFEGDRPDIDFDLHVSAAFPAGYSGSCPDQRFNGVLLEGDRLMPDIADITIAQMCTADYNPRTFLVALERDTLPAPPFHLVEWIYSSMALRIDVDLREPGSTLGESDWQIVEVGRPRTATYMPFVIEPGYPWELIVPAECDLVYLGEINGVGWHLEEGSSVPPSWVDMAVDGLIDLEIVLDEGPEPSVTVTAGGESVLYLPGEKPNPACNP